MKKILSLILAGLMTVSCASYIFADDAAVAEEAEAEVAVEEVAEEAEPATPYDFAIKFLGDKKIMQGKEDGKPHAADAVKRYEMALFMGRVLTGWVNNKEWEDHDSDTTGFTDLADSGAKDFLGALSFVSQKGIIEGYGDGTFKPEQTVTYREALTMAVRTLGYKGLAYPWGYIEKAVALGLTDGISGIAYTDEIARGVVAQIVFNMMVCADSAKLAMGGYAWEPIIITATDKAVLGGTDVKTVDAKLVGFKTVDELGQIGETAYYVDGAIFGFEGAHDDELALGHVYKALFEINDAAKVDLYAAVPYETATIANVGLTDDEGKAYDDVYPINTFLGKYSIVSKYSVTALDNQVNKFGKNEIIVLDAMNQISIVVAKDGKEYPFAVEWETGNILEQVKKDGKVVEGEWQVKWYWNEIFQCWFEITKLGDITDDIKSFIDEDAIVGMKLVTDKDIEDLKKAIADANSETKKVDGYAAFAGDKSAYASLVTFNMDADEAAERGIYEAYRLGYYSTCTAKNSKNADVAAVQFETKNVLGNTTSTGALVLEGAADYAGETYWFNGAQPEANGWVIYGVNYTTNGITVVKTIDGSDKDTYIGTGVVRGYSLANKQIWIGEEKLDLGYANLLGASFNDDFGKAANKEAFSDAFDKLFNNFVEYVVVDGKVVYIARKGATTAKYLVVDSYAGINNDGYITVNAYSTADLKLARYAIDTFGGWKKGDFFFYPQAIEDEFIKGSVYEITSYDADKDLYYVNCLGYFADAEDRQGNLFVVADGVDAKLTPIEISIDADGYKTVNGKESRVADTDKYIIIGSPFIDYRLGFTTPIYVYEGKAPEGWAVTGDALVNDGSTFIIVNPTAMTGFNADTYNTGFVAFVTKPVVGERVYDGYDGAAKYLLGATETYKLAAFNLMSGETFEGYATNKVYAKGEIYGTIGNIFAGEVPGWEAFKDAAEAAYTNADAKSGKYAFNEEYILVADSFNKEKILGTVDANGDALYTALGFTKNHKDIVSDIKVFSIVGGDVTTIKAFTADDYKAIEGITGIEDAFVIYNLKDNKVVIYVDLANAGSSNTAAELVESSNVIKVMEDAYIEALADAEITKDEDGNVTAATISKVTFNFFGDKVENDTHKAIADNDLYFGVAEECFIEDWETVATLINVNNADVEDIVKNIYGSIVADTYDNHGDIEDILCNLIQAVVIDFDDVEVLDDEWQQVDATFTAKMADGPVEFDDCEIEFTVCFKIEDGELIFKFDSDNGTNTIDGTDAEFIARADIK